MTEKSNNDKTHKQLLHLVFGGELTDPNDAEVVFRNLDAMDFVGAFSSYDDAKAAWKTASQKSVDNAHMRYFIIHAHKLINPIED